MSCFGAAPGKSFYKPSSRYKRNFRLWHVADDLGRIVECLLSWDNRTSGDEMSAVLTVLVGQHSGFLQLSVLLKCFAPIHPNTPNTCYWVFG